MIGSVDDVRFENKRELESSLGRLWREFRIMYSIMLMIVVTLFGIGISALAIIRESYFNEGRFPHLSEFFNFSYLFTTPLVLSLLIITNCILIAVYLFRSDFDRKRYYVVFNIVPSSDEYHEFSLSSLASLPSIKRINKLGNDQGDPLSEQQEFRPSSAINESLLNKFEMNGTGYYKNIFKYRFIVALYNRENTSNTFVFYSRHQSSWDHILKLLESHKFAINILNKEEIQV